MVIIARECDGVNDLGPMNDLHFWHKMYIYCTFQMMSRCIGPPPSTPTFLSLSSVTVSGTPCEMVATTMRVFVDSRVCFH